MDKSRPYYPTKAASAAAHAAKLRAEANRAAGPAIAACDWRQVRRKMVAIDSLNAEARRYDQLAQRFQAQGR